MKCEKCKIYTDSLLPIRLKDLYNGKKPKEMKLCFSCIKGIENSKSIRYKILWKVPNGYWTTLIKVRSK